MQEKEVNYDELRRRVDKKVNPVKKTNLTEFELIAFYSILPSWLINNDKESEAKVLKLKGSEETIVSFWYKRSVHILFPTTKTAEEKVGFFVKYIDKKKRLDVELYNDNGNSRIRYKSGNNKKFQSVLRRLDEEDMIKFVTFINTIEKKSVEGYKKEAGC